MSKNSQSYKEWNEGRDEMDGENDGCIIPIFLILFIIVIIISSYYSEEKIESQSKTECLCIPNK